MHRTSLHLAVSLLALSLVTGCTAIAGLDRFHPREGMDGDTDVDAGVDEEVDTGTPDEDGGTDDDAGEPGDDAGVGDAGAGDAGGGDECVPACGAGRDCCDGVCRAVDLPSRCGSCGNVCPDPPNADGTCAAFACGFTCRAGFADCNGVASDGCEADLEDASSCGSCDVMCADPELCLTSDPLDVRCGLDCAPGEVQCGLSCVDLDTSTQHCGACDDACHVPGNGSVECVAGDCVATCEAGFGDCDGDALDEAGNGCETVTTDDVEHCGVCANECPVGANATRACDAGLCQFTCESGFEDCNAMQADGCEANLGGPGSCGSCTLQCVAPTPLCDTSGTPTCLDDCPGSTVLCGTTCADLTGSTSHCGGCDMACPARDNASRTCIGSTCGFTCSPLFGDCNGAPVDGCEDSLASDVDQCGTCTNVCPTRANATRTCSAGSCGFTCLVGFEDCDGNPANGCEVQVTSDVDDCGTCDNVCPTRTNATRTCTAGTCGFSCTGTFSNCDGMAANGCEANLSADADHCGTCPTVCASAAGATRACVTGSCDLDCNASRGDCNGDLAMAPLGNGCEVDLSTSTSHCLSCGNACSVTMGMASCAPSGCTIASCTPGFSDCENGYSDGCESHLLSDLDDCGTCGTVCPTPTNATRTCNGVCSFTCNGTFRDCTVASGCETNIHTDPLNCNGCGAACPDRANATRTCSGGACGYACDAGFGDCDAGAANGCETTTTTNVMHCGMCANSCPIPNNATRGCAGGMCNFTCVTGFEDCDGLAANGCEADTESSVMTCGGCGIVCTPPANADPRCSGGACGFTCRTGFADCDGAAANGCELNTSTDPLNCGTCGNVCPTGECSAGACRFADILHYEVEENSGAILTNYAPTRPNSTIDGFPTLINWVTPGFAPNSTAYSLELPPTGSNPRVNPNFTPGTYASVTFDFWWRFLSGGGGSIGYFWRDGVGATTDFRGLYDGGRIWVRGIPGTSFEISHNVNPDGLVHHVAVVLDAATGQTRLYFDGATVGSGPYPGASVNLTGNLRVMGNLPGAGGSNEIRHRFDRYRLWGRALTGAEISEAFCQRRADIVVTSVTPTTGSNTNTLRPSLFMNTNHPVQRNVGTITLTGSGGTTIVYDLATLPSAIAYLSSDTQIRIRPGYLPRNETFTITWSGLRAAGCTHVVPPVSPAWTVVNNGCVPGQAMPGFTTTPMVGTTVTTVPSGITLNLSETNVEADTTSNGWVYIAGLTQAYRVRKDGSAVENLTTAGPLLTSTALGYGTLVNGTHLYAIESATATSGILRRFTQDGGTTWSAPLEDYLSLPVAPLGEFRTAAPLLSGSTAVTYLVTHSTSGIATELWSVGGNAAAIPQIGAVNTTTGTTIASCSGLVVDATYFYTACSTGGVVRVDRVTGAITAVANTLGTPSASRNSLQGQDLDADGLVDVLYYNRATPNAHYICHPDAPAPVTGTLATWAGNSASNYGLGYDRVARTLYGFNDLTNELVSIR